MINLILAHRMISTTHSIWVIERPQGRSAWGNGWWTRTLVISTRQPSARCNGDALQKSEWVIELFFLCIVLWVVEEPNLMVETKMWKPLNSTRFQAVFFFWGGRKKARWSRAINGYDGFGIASDWTCYGWVLAKEELGQPWRPRRPHEVFSILEVGLCEETYPWKTFPKNELRN